MGVGSRSESEASGDKRLGEGDTSSGRAKALLQLLIFFLEASC